MKLEKIKELLHEVDASGVTELEVQDGAFRLTIRKAAAPGASLPAAPAQAEAAGRCGRNPA